MMNGYKNFICWIQSAQFYSANTVSVTTVRSDYKFQPHKYLKSLSYLFRVRLVKGLSSYANHSTIISIDYPVNQTSSSVRASAFNNMGMPLRTG